MELKTFVQKKPLLKNLALILLTSLGLTVTAASAAPAVKPLVELHTSVGDIRIELDAERAPATVANFLQYVDSGFYDGLQFHRVVAGFVAQGGGYTADGSERPTRATVKNESVGGLGNARGTIAMARKPDPDSAAAQFYFNLKDNDALNAKGDQPGYTVFGHIVQGEDVLDRIGAAPTVNNGGAFVQQPREPILIIKAKRI
ncbi:MAG: peptidylprolyl isomerase [Porticoccaceae bacterium]